MELLAAASWRSNPTLFGHDLVELVATRKFLTCRNCWFIRQAAGKLATCTSRSKGPTKKQVATWKGLKKHHGLQFRFAEIWGVSLDELKRGLKRGLKRPAASKHGAHDSWKHDVCQDGDIHPNPGPSSWRVVSQRRRDVGHVESHRCRGADKSVAVLALQEVSARENDLISVRRKALACGYRFYHQPGVPSVGARGICSINVLLSPLLVMKVSAWVFGLMVGFL